MRQGLILALAAALAGCNVTPHKAYPGPSRSDSELSFLRAGGSGEELSPESLVDFRVIDGVPQRAAMYYASVLPGRHAVGFSERLRIGVRERTQFCALELETLAGCTYMPTPPSMPTDASRGPWQWNVDVVVAAACQRGDGFTQRVPARCGSSDQVFGRIAR